MEMISYLVDLSQTSTSDFRGALEVETVGRIRLGRKLAFSNWKVETN